MKKAFSLTMVFLLCLCLGACANGHKQADTFESALYTEDTQFGKGEKTVSVKVRVDDDSVTFTINTDRKTLGDALTDHELISGEEGPYGLYVKSVNGITADYDVNKTYWSLYKDGEVMQTGVDTTKISHGDEYELVLMK